MPSKTSDITNDSGFITNSVNNLVNYYLKNEVYTKDEVTALIGAIQQFHYEVVQELPQTGANNIMYLVPKSTSQTNNVYDEYVYSNGWEKIGDTEIDLSNYVTITMLNQALANYTTTANLTTLLNTKQNEITSSNKLNADLVDDTNSTNKFFSGNYNDLTNKPTIPDELSDLTDDSTHRFVTDTEKTTWNGKQDTLIAGDNITIQNNVISASGGGSDIPFYSILGTSSWINWDGANAITSSDSSASYWQEYIDLYLEQKTNNKPLPLLYYYIYNNQDVSYRYKQNVLFTPYHIISMGSSYNGIVLFGNAISRNFNMTGGISYMSTLSNVAKETIMPVIIIEMDKNYNFYMAVPQNILRPSDVLKISGAQTISGVKTFNALPVSSVTPTTSNQLTNKSYVDSVPTTYTGYDATKTQVLKNINGTFTWVDES